MTPPAGHEHVVVTGPQLSDAEFEAIRSQAPAGTRVLRTWPGLARQIGEAAAVISMAGYNTTCEILATSTSALLVPREVPRQEQLIRARALERAGAIDHIRWDEITPEDLTQWAAQAVTTRIDRDLVRVDGLAAVSVIAADLLERARLTFIDDTPSGDLVGVA